ncbi:MAG: PQQ-binding-like beta-propeller repeat protein [Bacteroidota bacterium]
MISRYRISLWIFVYTLTALCGFSCQKQEESVASASKEKAEYYNTWEHYLGDPGRSHYANLSQIDPANVERLEVAWTYKSGGLKENGNSQIQTNPLIIEEKLIGVNASNHLFAINNTNGEEIWKFSPGSEDQSGLGLSRGISFWRSKDSEYQSRIFFGSGPNLYAVNLENGELIPSFGENGKIDLRENLGRDPEKLTVVLTTPGAIYNDLYIIGSRTGESPGAAPGHIRAYNVKSGELVWTFKTIPHPGEVGYETWPKEAYLDVTIGGANSWAGLALDEENEIVYVPTGSAAFDWFGGNRKGDNLFSNCLLALNANTGERIWHFQFVKHDLWDRDIPAPPNLLEVKKEGKTIPAVAQVTKSGHIYVFNRLTGESLFPLSEKKYPPTTLAGDEAASTQVLPAKPEPFARQRLEEEDLFAPNELAFVEDFVDKNPNSKKLTVKQKLSGISSNGQFIPIDTTGVILFPGADGGAEWGGAAVDPRSGVMYVNSNEMAWIVKMSKVGEKNGKKISFAESLVQIHCTRCHGGNLQGLGVIPNLQHVEEKLSIDEVKNIITKGKGSMPGMPNIPEEEVDEIANFLMKTSKNSGDHRSERTFDTPYAISGFGRFKDISGFPAVKPPWGTLNAIDLNSGEYLWKIPLGHDKSLTEHMDTNSGTENYGGPVITKSQLLFIAATKDEKIRAFHMKTGELLWEKDLPAGGYATPATYESAGKQYVVIACGGGKMGTKSGDLYVAYALPQD